MDQRSFTEFMRMVLSKCRQKAKQRVLLLFCGLEKSPAMVDAFQAAGWVYRGIVVWDKGVSRAIQIVFAMIANM